MQRMCWDHVLWWWSSGVAQCVAFSVRGRSEVRFGHQLAVHIFLCDNDHLGYGAAAAARPWTTDSAARGRITELALNMRTILQFTDVVICVKWKEIIVLCGLLTRPLRPTAFCILRSPSPVVSWCRATIGILGPGVRCQRAFALAVAPAPSLGTVGLVTAWNTVPLSQLECLQVTLSVGGRERRKRGGRERRKSELVVKHFGCIIFFICRRSLSFTMLSWDWSSISRPCIDRRSSVISVLDVWITSVLIATSLFSSSDYNRHGSTQVTLIIHKTHNAYIYK